MDRSYNFSAGASMLPPDIAERAAKEIFSFGDGKKSIMEIDHRSPQYRSILSKTEESLRRLVSIPSNYKVLFMPGSPSAQFSAIPLNLLSEHKCADYIITGQLSDRAMKEAKKYGDIAIAASSAGANPVYSTVPLTGKSDFRPDTDYVYLCFNNPIYGTKFNYIPETGNIPLVADMTTSILSEPIDVSKFGLIYAGTQANIASCAMTVVIIREDLIGNARPDTPMALDYKAMLENKMMYNMPPCYDVYMAGLVFDWLLSIGGLEEMKHRNERKCSLIYDYLDSQTYYTAPVNKNCRSLTNIVFTTSDRALDEKFISEAAGFGLLNLEGHSSVGGMRASIYNAMPYDGVRDLVAFMKRFALENPKI